MAINVVTATVPRTRHNGKTPFCKHFDSSDLSDCEQIMTKPSGASGIYLKRLVIASTRSLSVTVGDGETSNAVTTAVIGPITLNRLIGTPADTVIPATIVDYTFENELLFSTDISIDASGAGIVWGLIEGFSA